MENYEFVNVRFNMENEDEKEIFKKLNPKNKGGSIKKSLMHYYKIYGDSSIKSQLEPIVRDILSSIQNDIVNDLNKKEIKNINSKGIKIKVLDND